jgi:MFS family permease|tara:strand:+ start:3711 stop:4973 length:1263 start_codon:yes stop_codon:yes gene_type:complete
MGFPSYRVFWFGTLASVCGFQVLNFAQFWVVHRLTGDPLFLGWVGLANAVPAIVLNLFGGVLADRMERRKLIAITQTVNGLIILILAVVTFTGVVQAWHVILLAFFAGAVNAFDQPARMALYPILIDRSVMMNAVSLNSAVWTGTRIIAPAVAGLIITVVGEGFSFLLSAMGFFTLAVVVMRLKIPDSVKSERRERKSRSDLSEGIKFILGNSIFTFLIAITFFNSFFGMSVIPMMPVFAVDILKVGADGQGVMMGVGGVGAFAITLILGRIPNLRHRGMMIVLGSAVFGLALVLLAVSSKELGNYPLAVLLMFVMGAFSSVYMISIMSSLQLMVPDHMRGRVMGFYGMTWSIMPLGAMYTGALAKVFADGGEGVPIAVAIGGILLSVFAIGPVLMSKKIRNLDAIIEQRRNIGESPAMV